ncbi:tetraacyldisaccharide 4'-kinase [Gillisia sp. M10.2A]|uniref:Tetraacyldisaccharide 4'-kinase n=1 Tax=Gillisia lutea TaxID=2909668 RepID=A0ABS9ELQ0_9FLAO|nr:tetraacyldisaccharide 4'-kinase [Gillisia lutea]MCF4102423.1 tetraacyldisaccharide 4'-kinase [Gillisia lutea]
MSILRKILFPLALVYGIIILIRNFLYDSGVFKSTSFSIPVICVGNLSVGGTGKTPMIEYLLVLLGPNYKTATLSRGYGRATKGFHLLKETDDATEVGDEPLQFKTKFKDSIVAVDEKRVRGISVLQEKCAPEVVLLDDAFQHRKVRAGLYILLTTYGQLYSKDYILPMGDLREPRAGAKRANIVVVTKCPRDLNSRAQAKIRESLKLEAYQKLFFSYIAYSKHLYKENKMGLITSLADQKVTLVTGIAKPKPLCDYLDGLQINYDHLDFPDHHNFTSSDLEKIAAAPIVLTTEKDYMRLKGVLNHPNLYKIPIKMKFINSGLEFDSQIERYILNEK